MGGYEVVRLDRIEAVACPCGFSRRAFTDIADAPASVHMVQIEQDARVHYHKRMTEIYVILEGSGYMELDSRRLPVTPMTAVMIKPGCRHRAVGEMKILNIVIPPFASGDEFVE
ncbi:MAG: cupin domain-containing protein [Sedimentisphaerales bacterium]|nr:cupin domain-containing protein [Sedimentisphaerales bacterium]